MQLAQGFDSKTPSYSRYLKYVLKNKNKNIYESKNRRVKNSGAINEKKIHTQSHGAEQKWNHVAFENV